MKNRYLKVIFIKEEYLCLTVKIPPSSSPFSVGWGRKTGRTKRKLPSGVKDREMDYQLPLLAKWTQNGENVISLLSMKINIQ